MTKQSNLISELRETIARKAQEWLDEHVYGYLPQEGNFRDVSPDKFIQVRQIQRWAGKETTKRSRNLSIEIDDQPRFTRTRVREAIEENPKLVILGDPGLGKTTSLLHLARDYAKDKKKPIPIYLELKNFDESYKDLQEYISLSLDIDPYVLKRHSHIFLLDGFSELGPSGAIRTMRKLQHLLSIYRKSRCVITSRKVAYLHGLEGWPTCEILELDDASIEGYLALALGSEQAKHVLIQILEQRIFDIARVPLFLTFICELNQADQPIPNSRGELLDSIVRHKYLQDFTLRGKSPADFVSELETLTIYDCLDIIGWVAHQVVKDTDKITFDERLLRQTLSKKVPRQIGHVISLFEHLRLIERHDVKEKDRTRTHTIYSFWHQSFLEYFAGYHFHSLFHENDSKEKLLEKASLYFEFNKWDELLKIFLGLSSKDLANRIFSLALEQDIFLAIDYFSNIESILSDETRKKFHRQIEDLLGGWHRNGKRYLVKALSRTRCYSITHHLIKLLEDEDFEIRSEAIKALGRIGNPEAVSAIKGILRDRDKRIQRSAIEVLGRIGDPQAVPHLIPFLKNESLRICMYAAKALYKLKYTEIAHQLLNQLEDKDTNIRIKAALILGYMGYSDALPKLTKLLKDHDDRVRIAALSALRDIGDASAVKFVIDLLKDKSKSVRKLALNTLGWIGHYDATPHIIPLLKTKDVALVKEAIEALCSIADPRAVPYLLNLDKDFLSQYGMAINFHLFKDDRATNYMIDMLEDNDIPNAIGAAITLREIGDPRAVPHLIKQLHSDDKILRLVSAFALAAFSDPQAIAHLTRLLKNADDLLLSTVITSLCQNLAHSNYSWPHDLLCMMPFITQQSRKDGDKFGDLYSFRRSAKRRFIYLPELKKAKTPAPPLEEAKKPYAKMWSSKERDVRPIERQEYDDLITKKSDYDIFTIDNGEYLGGSVGAVYFDNQPISFQAEKANRPEDSNSKQDQEKMYVTSPLHYRILVFTLKEKGQPGEIFNFVRECWFDNRAAKELRTILEKETKGETTGDRSFSEATSKYRKDIGGLSKILFKYLKIKIVTGRTRKYRLYPVVPSYCHIDIDSKPKS